GATTQVTADSCIWPLNTIYIHNEVGKSLALAGLILMFNQGSAISGNLVGGTLFDKISGYQAILMSTGLTLIGLVTLSINHGLLPYSILLVVIGFGSG